jgi:hypothetical protein
VVPGDIGGWILGLSSNKHSPVPRKGEETSSWCCQLGPSHCRHQVGSRPPPSRLARTFLMATPSVSAEGFGAGSVSSHLLLYKDGVLRGEVPGDSATHLSLTSDGLKLEAEVITCPGKSCFFASTSSAGTGQSLSLPPQIARRRQ